MRLQGARPALAKLMAGPPKLSVGKPGPADDYEDAWEQQAEELQLNALQRVQATAEKWAGSISALLALFSAVAVVKGPQDLSKMPEPYPVLLALVIGAAVVLAVIAAGAALLAAQGTPEKVPLPTGERLRAWSRNEERTARRRLFWSRWLTVAALVLLAAGTGIAWCSPRKDDEQNLLVRTKEGLRCGKLIESRKGRLIIKTDTKAHTPVSVSNLVDFAPVDDCP